MAAEVVLVRYVAVPDHQAAAGESGRSVCAGCAFVAPASTCKEMSVRMVDIGLPDCATGFVYRQEIV